MRAGRAVTLAAIALLVAPAGALGEEADALELARRVEKSFSGFGGQRVRMKMIVEEREGASKVYEFVELAKETPEGLRMLVRFDAPEHLKGSALLSVEKPGAPPEVWMYVAETKVVRRLSGTDRSARFFASELDIEQLTFPRANDYDHRILGAGDVGGTACTRVEQVPKAERSNYAKLITCVDAERLVPLAIEYFDRSGRALKRLVASGYEKTAGGWRPRHIVVENHHTRRKTILEAGVYQVGIALSDKLFTVAQLRAR